MNNTNSGVYHWIQLDEGLNETDIFLRIYSKSLIFVSLKFF